jgi:hypothetical protein
MIAANRPRMKRCSRTAIPPDALSHAWLLRIINSQFRWSSSRIRWHGLVVVPARFRPSTFLALQRPLKSRGSSGGKLGPGPCIFAPLYPDTRLTSGPASSDCTTSAKLPQPRRPCETFASGVFFGVSTDSVESHQEFIKKHGLPFPLLSDSDQEIVKAYQAAFANSTKTKRGSRLCKSRRT